MTTASLPHIGIVAPTPALRAGVRALFDSAAYTIVADAPSLPELLAGTLVLDGVVVADETALDDLDEINYNLSSLALVVLTDTHQTAALLHRLPLRGWAIVPSNADPDMLQSAMNSALQGFVVMPQLWSGDILDQRFSLPVTQNIEQQDPLTPREQQVLELIAEGASNKHIAQTLVISEHTVKFHVSSIYAKLGAASRTDAINRGIRRGLILF